MDASTKADRPTEGPSDAAPPLEQQGPPVGRPAGTGTTGRPARKGAWVWITVTVIGGLVIIGSIASTLIGSFSVFSTVQQASGDEVVLPPQVSTAAVDDVTAVTVTGAAADVDITYGPVSEATLTQTDLPSELQWTMSATGTELVISSPDVHDRWGAQWDWDWEPRVQLVLPEALEESKPDVTVDADAGDASLTGAFGAVTLGTTAGDVEFTGTADSLSLTSAAGDADFSATVTGDVSADLDVGNLSGRLEGTKQPTSIDLRSSVGDIDLSVPKGAYAVTGESGVGDRAIEIDDSPSATVTLAVSTDAGDVSVRYAD